MRKGFNHKAPCAVSVQESLMEYATDHYHPAIKNDSSAIPQATEWQRIGD